MLIEPKRRLHLISGRVHPDLAVEVAERLNVELVEPSLGDFANGEIGCRFEQSVRGGDVFILQSHGPSGDLSINDAIMEHLIMCDAAKRASAKRITAIAPFLGYARQDRKASGREPITAKLVADQFYLAGAQRMMSVDLHASQVQGFFDGPWDHLVAMPVLCEALGELDGELCVVSPDAGRVKVAQRYANRLGADLAFVHKRRSTSERNSVEAIGVIGEVRDKVCVIIDDMIDTGGTIAAASELLVEQGARSVIAAATHGVLSGPAHQRLHDAPIERVIVTNTLPQTEGLEKKQVVSIAPLLAAAIRAVIEDGSVIDLFGGVNFN